MMTIQQNDASVKNITKHKASRYHFTKEIHFMSKVTYVKKLNDTQFPHDIGLFAEICPVVCLSSAHVVASVIKRQCCQGAERSRSDSEARSRRLVERMNTALRFLSFS